MDPRTPRRLLIAMAAVFIAAILIALLNAWSRGLL
jgi:hypothetical protein